MPLAVWSCRHRTASHAPSLNGKVGNVTAGAIIWSRRVATVDYDGLHFPRAAAAKRGRLIVFLRREAGDALLEGREFDHNKALGPSMI